MKRKRCIVLISSIVFLSLFIINIVTTGQEKLSSLTLTNIEALSTNENTTIPCNAANGYCVTGGFPIQGIHFEKD